MALTRIKSCQALAALLLIVVAAARTAAADTITIAWDANPASENVAGYNVYIGTASSMYGAPIDVHNVTTYAFTAATAGQTYYFAVQAYDAFGTPSELSTEVFGLVDGVPDITAPTVTISSPTSASTYSTTASVIALGGTASDNAALTQVSYTLNGGASTNASGTTLWSVDSVVLQFGSNTIVVTARDAAGNMATDILTVTRTDGSPPTISIGVPTGANTYSTTSSTITIGGLATDNVGITQITWSTSTGQSGNAAVATSWSIANIALQSGTNVITVTARDAAGNSRSDTLTVIATFGTVTAVSATPTSGSGSSQTFAYQFSDSAGAADITQAWVYFNTTFTTSAAGSCMAYYDRATNQINLINDAGTAWMSAAVGSSGTLQNNVCAVATGGTSVSLSGSTFTLNLPLTFTSAFAGVRNVYLYGSNAGGNNSGWQTLGSWTVPAASTGSVTADSVTPTSGSGSSQTFVLKYSHAAGAGNLSQAWVWFNPTLAGSSANSCMAYYSRPTNEIFLLNDAATAWMSAVLGTSGTLQSSSCSIALASSVATANGITLTLSLAIAFTSAFTGGKNIYMYANDAAGRISGWQTRGAWTVPAGAVAVTADSLTPNAGSGTTQTFALRYSDTTGAANLTQGWVYFNATFTTHAAGTCLLFYNKPTNEVNLIDDTGTIWMSSPLGGGGALQNSVCRVSLDSTQVSSSGNTMTLSLTLTFSPSFAGTKDIYMYAAGGSANSGWQTRGTWTVPSGASPVTADSVTPDMGSGTPQTFALRYSDTNGAANLTQAWAYFNAIFTTNAAGTCMVFYDQPTNRLNLIDDMGAAWISSPLGSGGTLQNSVCSVSLGSTQVSSSGNTMTLSLTLTFTPSFAGTKNIYMYGSDASANSGWQTRGTWTTP
jgi:uncharacterized membrane protein/fibronectin type 3 domain-containing protein